MTAEQRRFSPSVSEHLSLSSKLGEGLRLFRQYRELAREGHDFGAIMRSVEEYDELLRAHAGIGLEQAHVLEIGFGARPYRQMLLHSLGIDAAGVDAEVPLLSGRPAEFREMLRRNGVERALKSFVRHTFFGRTERRAFETSLRQRGLTPRLDASRLIVSDAGQLELAPASLDLIISEDVFEHIDGNTLESLIPRMATWLRPGGLALIRPNIFTGITGGHLLEWSRAAMRRPPAKRQSEPWEHLRQRRFSPNTHLNEMTRAEYRELFETSFEIVEERVALPDLGRAFLDNGAQDDLASFPEEELFSNQVLFVLRGRDVAPEPAPALDRQAASGAGGSS